MSEKFNFSRQLYLEMIEESRNDIEKDDGDIFDHIAELPPYLKNQVI